MKPNEIIEQLIILHLYLLESLSINDRKLKYTMTEINNIKTQHSAITSIIDLFIKRLGDVFIHLNNELRENEASKYLFNTNQNNNLKNICDIFDGRLFFHTLNQLNANGLEKMLSNLDNLCNNKKLFNELKNSIDTSILKQKELGMFLLDQNN